jgi:hypothetical protein
VAPEEQVLTQLAVGASPDTLLDRAYVGHMAGVRLRVATGGGVDD